MTTRTPDQPKETVPLSPRYALRMSGPSPTSRATVSRSRLELRWQGKGVGQLVEMAISRGRKARKKLKIGICGEHGGDPETVIFCHGAGMDYVSCSPFRVPVARLAAAHAVLQAKS